jgi:hypothetical protein
VKRPISIAGRQAPLPANIYGHGFQSYMRKRLLEAAHQSIRFGLYSSAKSPASLRSPMIYKGSARDPYVRFVRAPPSNGIGLIRSSCARWIAAFTTIFALFKNLGWEEKYCLSWQSSSSGSAHAPAYQ